MNNQLTIIGSGVITSLTAILAGTLSGIPELTHAGIYGLLTTAGYAAWTVRA